MRKAVKKVKAVKIRQATPRDAKKISRVLNCSYNICSRAIGEQAFRDEFKRGITYIVAEKGKVIIGITTYIVHGLPQHGLVELDRIAVLPEYRGRGIGKILFNALIESARKYFRERNSKLRKLFIYTHADNKNAHAFYKKLGMRKEATLKDHYYKGKNEYVFSRFFD